MTGLRGGGGAAAAQEKASFTKGQGKEIKVAKSVKTAFLSSD